MKLPCSLRVHRPTPKQCSLPNTYCSVNVQLQQSCICWSPYWSRLIERVGALEILTGCFILVQGNTIAVMGSFIGLKQVRRIVEECMMNKMHPVYNIKVIERYYHSFKNQSN
ncbi:hypothetical protein GLYMA_09G058066v4 [Glycine max]|nr:hypothetical protein GLYMA_09G058066v4 [Glycine max]KAH1041666.1 hypothetical protein GYH30_024161 [Glycine max]